MKGRSYEQHKGVISAAVCVLAGGAGQSIHPRHVAVRALLQTTDDQPVRASAVRPSPSE